MTPLESAVLGMAASVPAALVLIGLGRLAGRVPVALVWSAAVVGVARPPHAFVTWPRWLDALADCGPWVLFALLTVDGLVAAQQTGPSDGLGLRSARLGPSWSGLAPRLVGLPIGSLAMLTGLACGVGRVTWDLPGGTRIAPVALLLACLLSLLIVRVLLSPDRSAGEHVQR